MNASAVLAAYNQYKNFPRRDWLTGCSLDLGHVHDHLVKKMSWPSFGLVSLLDSQGGAAVEKGHLLAMVTAPGPSRHQVWLHSSHGSNNPDKTQADGLQELLLCWDTVEANGLFVEDTCISARWIGQVLLPQVRPVDTLDIILDCCCAPQGSQLKLLGRRPYSARFMPRSVTGPKVMSRPVEQAISVMPPNVALWSACRPDQTSADTSDGGAFTCAFLENWKPGRTRSDLIYHARKSLAHDGYAQEPHLYCGDIRWGIFGG